MNGTVTKHLHKVGGNNAMLEPNKVRRAVTVVAELLTIIQVIRLLRGGQFSPCTFPLVKV